MKHHKYLFWGGIAVIVVAILDLLTGQSDNPVPIIGNLIPSQAWDGILIIGGFFLLFV